MFHLKNLLFIILFMIAWNSMAQHSETDFEAMKGTRFRYPISDNSDTLSAQEIVELRNLDGRPIWFARNIFKNVCLSGKCKLVRVRIYWNGAVNYAGFTLIDNEPLTKTDHVVFDVNDYRKLDGILADTHSVLKNLQLKDLIVKSVDKKENDIDGFSGATLPTLQDYVVKNAVYTCYTLWHTVYGNSRNIIDKILEQRVDRNYLKLIFNENDPEYQIWAINFVGAHTKFQQLFYPEILDLIKSKEPELSAKALQYFGTPIVLTDVKLQQRLVNLIKEVSSNTKFDIIKSFSSLSKVDNETILLLLDQYLTKHISPAMFGAVCKMIDPKQLQDSRIMGKLQNIANGENLYVRNIVQKLISH